MKHFNEDTIGLSFLSVATIGLMVVALQPLMS